MKVLGGMTITRLIFDDLEEIVLPSDLLVDPANGNVEVPQDRRFQVWKEMQSFVLRVGDVRSLIDEQLWTQDTHQRQAYLDIFRAMCMNRSRMRRMLCHLILEWENIQLEVRCLSGYMNSTTMCAEMPLGRKP